MKEKGSEATKGGELDNAARSSPALAPVAQGQHNNRQPGWLTWDFSRTGGRNCITLTNQMATWWIQNPIFSPLLGITLGICATLTLRLGSQGIPICLGLSWILHWKSLSSSNIPDKQGQLVTLPQKTPMWLGSSCSQGKILNYTHFTGFLPFPVSLPDGWFLGSPPNQTICLSVFVLGSASGGNHMPGTWYALKKCYE